MLIEKILSWSFILDWMREIELLSNIVNFVVSYNSSLGFLKENILPVYHASLCHKLRKQMLGFHYQVIRLCSEKVLVASLCLTLCDPMDCSLPGFSVHGILQARILECVAMALQGIFQTQGSNLVLPHCRQILHHLSHWGCPTM